MVHGVRWERLRSLMMLLGEQGNAGHVIDPGRHARGHFKFQPTGPVANGAAGCRHFCDQEPGLGRVLLAHGRRRRRTGPGLRHLRRQRGIFHFAMTGKGHRAHAAALVGLKHPLPRGRVVTGTAPRVCLIITPLLSTPIWISVDALMRLHNTPPPRPSDGGSPLSGYVRVERVGFQRVRINEAAWAQYMAMLMAWERPPPTCSSINMNLIKPPSLPTTDCVASVSVVGKLQFRTMMKNKKTPPCEIELTAWWGHDDINTSIQVTQEDWAAIQAGDLYETESTYWYEGNEYAATWEVEHKKVNIHGEDGNECVVGMSIDELNVLKVTPDGKYL